MTDRHSRHRGETFMIHRFAIAALAFAVLAGPAAADAPKPVVRQVFSGTETASGQPLMLPQGQAEVIVSTYEIPPGAALPVHKHPFPRYAYVLAGRLAVTATDTGKVSSYGPGDFVVEMLDTWHSGTTVGDETVKLLVIDQVEPGKPNVVLKQ